MGLKRPGKRENSRDFHQLSLCFCNNLPFCLPGEQGEKSSHLWIDVWACPYVCVYVWVCSVLSRLWWSKGAGVFLHVTVDSMLVGGCQCEYRAEWTFCLPFIIHHRFSAISHVSPQRGRCAVTDSYFWQENSLFCLRICRIFIRQSGMLREKSTLVRSLRYYRALMNCSFSSIRIFHKLPHRHLQAMISCVGHYFELYGPWASPPFNLMGMCPLLIS